LVTTEPSSYRLINGLTFGRLRVAPVELLPKFPTLPTINTTVTIKNPTAQRFYI
jgi:hypothetical protein